MRFHFGRFGTGSLLLVSLVCCVIACSEPGPTAAPVSTAIATGTAPPTTTSPTPLATRLSADLFLPIIKNPATSPIAVLPIVIPSPPAAPVATPDFPHYHGPPLQRDQMGIQIDIHQEDQRTILRQLQQLEVGWVKLQISWKVYEPQQGSYAADRLDELDRLVEAANNNDIKVLLSVSKAPEWSRPTTEMDGPPTDYATFESFMTFLAGRYHGRVSAYELWNEPNLQREWNGVPLDPAGLVQLIAAGASGARAADPDALLISAAPATTGINDGINAIDDRVYLHGMLEAGVGDLVDGIGAHPYGWANPPDSSAAHPDPAIPSHNNHPSFFFSDTVADYEALLREYGLAKQLWVTEFGWGTFDGILDDDGQPASPPAGAEFMMVTNEQQQAQYILRAFELGQADPQVGPMMLWNLNFGAILGSDYSESGYGILRPDGSLRPAFRAIRAAPKE